MSAEMAQKLVQGGIKAVRSGDHDLARKAFTQALKLDPNNEAAWLGMATITEEAKDKLRILNKVLEINPDNDRAKEAIRRLGRQDEVVEEALETETTDEETSDTMYASGEIAPITGVTPGDTGKLSDFPKPDWALDEDVPGVDDVVDDDIFAEDSAPIEAEPVIDPIPPLEIRNSADVFATLPPPPNRGQGGIPVPQREVVETLAGETEASVQAYLENALADYLTPQTTWTRKTAGRAGSGEYRNLLVQITTASFIGAVVILFALGVFLLTNATTRRILLAPTRIPSATPTNTPTATPGVTNTPSPTPLTPATETPTLPARATLGSDDPHFPPQPTGVYYPQSVRANSVPDAIVALMNEGELDEARDLIDEGVQIEIDTGELPPTYRLSEWYLLNDDPEQARQVLTDWEEEWRERDSGQVDNNEALLLLGLARVDIYEARNGLGDRITLLNDAQDRIEASLGMATGNNQILVPDRLNPDGYLLLAEAFILRSNIDGALETIDNALEVTFQNRSLLGNTALRMAKARILADAGRYDEAFQELYFVLEFNPFQEEALIMQTELALETDQPGLAVLYAEQYLLYYPGSLQGFYLLGQAREAESKYDLALTAYTRAVAGDRDNEEYTSDPYFLENLLARADLLVRQGQQDEAADDFALALELAGNNPELRARSLSASYSAGNYSAVLEDVEDLLGNNAVQQSSVLYYQGLSLIALAQEGDAEGDYALAIEALNDALARNLPAELRPNAYENLALANFQENNLTDALEAINNAIDLEATGYRIYVRALILESQRSLDEAFLDYEFIVTWGQYYNFPFYEDARARYDELLSGQR